MKRFLAVLALSFAASGAAYAGGSSCSMPKGENTAAAPLPAEGSHVKLAVKGMTCGSCADKVKTALLGVDGVTGATVDVAAGVAEVAFDDKKASNDQLLAAVNGTGHFTATVATN